jgi:protein-disulfide isomerase
MTRRLLVAFALLGLGASAASSYVHHQLLTQPTYASFCDVSVTVSCTQAYLSRYGSILGVPVAIAGVTFFTIVLLMIVLTPRPEVQRAGKKIKSADATASGSVPASVFVMSLFGLAFTLYLAWASLFQLGTLCLLCLASYIAVAGLAVVAGRAVALPLETLPERAARDFAALAKSPAAFGAAVVVLGAASLAALSFPNAAGASEATGADAPAHVRLTDGQRAQFEAWYKVQPVVALPIDKGAAKVLVVKFNDYQCPPCRQTFYEYKGILATHTASGDVAYVLKHFPLELECNTLNAGHTAACEAAAASVMARAKGTADTLEAWLFAHQGPPFLAPEQVRAAAAAAAGITDFDAQYAGVLKQVAADAALGRQLGVKSTPTFFINGRLIAGALPAAAFEAAIEIELRR